MALTLQRPVILSGSSAPAAGGAGAGGGVGLPGRGHRDDAFEHEGGREHGHDGEDD